MHFFIACLCVLCLFCICANAQSLKSDPQCRFPCLLRRRADVADKLEKRRGRCFFFFVLLIILMFLIILSSSDPLNDCFQEQQGVLSLGQECEDWPVQRVSNILYLNAKNKVNILRQKSFSIHICPAHLSCCPTWSSQLFQNYDFLFFCSAPWKRRM